MERITIKRLIQKAKESFGKYIEKLDEKDEERRKWLLNAGVINGNVADSSVKGDGLKRKADSKTAR